MGSFVVISAVVLRHCDSIFLMLMDDSARLCLGPRLSGPSLHNIRHLSNKVVETAFLFHDV